MKQNFKLTATALKNGKTLYQVIDETGKVISKRTSTRNYVACTIDGSYYFGRLDLIGKGENGQTLARIQEYKDTSREAYDALLKKTRREWEQMCRMHLHTWATNRRKDEPMEEWQLKHLEENYSDVPEIKTAKTQWDYQVITMNPERHFQSALRYIGDFETWKAKRIALVAEREPQMQIAYLGK